MTINVLDLFTADTAEKILARGLEVAKLIGLPTTTWRENDPTRSLYAYLADVIAALELKYVEFAKAGFMSTAEGDWATLHAKEVYGITRTEATYATPSITLHNNGGGVFPDLGAGGLTVQCTLTKKTFRSVNSPGILGPGATLTFNLIADEAGADSSVGANELDTFITPATLAAFGVSIVSSSSAAAQDQQTETELRDQCGDTLGALSPDGPPDAYEYVCKSAELTGTTEINRATAIGDSSTGEVTVYVASASGGVTSPSVTAAQAACLTWATPLCITPTVISATPLAVNISAQISGQDIPASFLIAITGRLGALFQALPIGGTVYRSRLIAEIHAAVPQAVSVNLVTPAANVTLAAYNVPTMGVIDAVQV